MIKIEFKQMGFEVKKVRMKVRLSGSRLRDLEVNGYL